MADKELGVYQRALQAVDHMVAYVDRDYTYRAVSGGYTHFFKRPASEIVGLTAAELHGRERFEQAIKANLDKIFAGAEPFSDQLQINSDGQTLTVRSDFEAVVDARGGGRVEPGRQRGVTLEPVRVHEHARM